MIASAPVSAAHDGGGDQGDVGVVEAAQDAGEVDGDVVVAEAGRDAQDGGFGGRAAELAGVQGGDGVLPVDVGVGVPVVAGAGADAAGGEVGPGQPGVVGADQFGGGGVASSAARCSAACGIPGPDQCVMVREDDLMTAITTLIATETLTPETISVASPHPCHFL